MAEVFLYSGPNQKVTKSTGGTFTLYNGEYVFFLGSATGSDSTFRDIRLHTFVAYNGLTPNKFVHTTPMSQMYLSQDKMNSFGPGHLTTIRTWNFLKYGNSNRHDKSGGCMYTIRNSTGVYSSVGGKVTTLNAGDVVIIGQSKPHGSTDKEMRIRMWGFKRGGRGGADVETSGCFVDGKYQNSVANYAINTL